MVDAFLSDSGVVKELFASLFDGGVVDGSCWFSCACGAGRLHHRPITLSFCP